MKILLHFATCVGPAKFRFESLVFPCILLLIVVFVIFLQTPNPQKRSGRCGSRWMWCWRMRRGSWTSFRRTKELVQRSERYNPKKHPSSGVQSSQPVRHNLRKPQMALIYFILFYFIKATNVHRHKVPSIKTLDRKFIQRCKALVMWLWINRLLADFDFQPFHVAPQRTLSQVAHFRLK